MNRFIQICVLIFLLSVSVNAITSNEILGLQAIRSSTAHNGWISTSRNTELSYDTSWNDGAALGPCGDTTSQNEDAWFGVICAGSGGQNVEVLLLASNNLVGTLPEDINKLTYMKQLYLFDNTLSGSIPTNFNRLTALTHLYIWNNQFTSVLNVNSLPSLEKFYFEDNSVVDSNINWLSTLPSLLEIDGSGNSITGTIPSNIQNAPLLRKIDFTGNSLSGSIPRQLLEHPSLIFLYLGSNSLSGGIPMGIDISGDGLLLSSLDFSNNNLHCKVPNWIYNSDITIDITNNPFFCPVIASRGNLVTTPETCVTVTQTDASATEYEILSNTPSSITLTGTNLNLCTTGGYQCKWNDQIGGGTVTVDASSFTSNTITCPMPNFSTGGNRYVCIAQDGEEIVDNCTFVKTYYDCSDKCKNGGVCDEVTGECICVKGKWQGPTCEERDCDGCNEARGGGYCNTTSGTCICNEGWTGPTCSNGNKECNVTCEPNGYCSEFDGKCVCSLGWQGEDCSEVFCPDCFTDGGYCQNGTCVCYEYWSGVLCNVPGRPCPNNSTCGSTDSPPRGRCNAVTGTCSCYSGWEGDECQYKKCPGTPECFGHGTCNRTTGVCSCDEFYEAPTCAVKNIPCPNSCSGNGVCNFQTGICSCRYPFNAAEDCSYANCNPADCSGHGQCNNQTGQCECYEPWTGFACSTPNATCPNDCSGVGSCNKQTGVCICPQGYDSTNYPDCSVRLCPGDQTCSGHGTCNTETGACNCEENYLGNICQTSDFDCPDRCNDNGYCNRRTGICACYVGYEGESCLAKTCNGNCTYPNGVCNTTTGVCACGETFDGDDCSLFICENDCLNGGDCDNTQGVCACSNGFSGENCALISCPNDCSGHGTCIGGVCFCTDRYYEADCSVQEPDYPLIVVVVILCVLGGLVLIGIIFMVWRQVMIANLTAQVAAQGGQGVDMDVISDSS
eukprot:TRINITY_DN367_c0_g1_i1.p1 TRINITY_DN367_c0_g1~~TRINITY_DN367_c0_g1_i1.p1  ORF type:complete len:953 (-),score=178.41 TRINITY_DN367_c0_g1_i1:45-2903(-)